MEPLRVNRRLTCILAADAVGYSTLMSEDEAGTIRILAAHRAVIDGIIAFHDGRIVGTAGDSVLAEFGSAVEAVRCATEMQEALKTRNEALPEDHRLYFRVGVNLGEVVVKGKDLLGDGVNVAARLESIAEPGGVCIASSVYDQITGKLDLGFLDIGEQNLKNISRPIHVYRVAGTGIPVRPVAAGRVLSRKPFSLALGAAAAAVALLGVAWYGGWVGGESSSAAHERAQAIAEDAKRQAEAAASEAKRHAKSEAELMRARAEAEKARREAEAKVAEITARAAASEQSAQAAKAASPPLSRVLPTRTVGETTRYDGGWMATFACAGFEEIPAGTFNSRVTVRGGEFVVEPGVRGQAGYWHVSGSPAGDGSLVLTGMYIPRTKARVSQEGRARFDGRLIGDHFVLDGRFGRRNCSLTMARAGR
jgi:class 3 adenylate cyclase